jgi:hypothetical protein
LLGRVRAPSRSPTSKLVCSPPTPSSPSASAPVVPRLRPTSSRALVLCRSSGRRRVHPANTPHVGDWSPDLRLSGLLTRRNEGLPGFWAVLFVRAVVEDPAGCSSLLARSSERLPSPSGNPTPWAPGMTIAFVAAWPTAHTLAHLRIAAPVTGNAARLATGLGGLTPDRAGFAPAGRQTRFHDFIASSILPDQPAWSHLDRLSASAG